MKKQTVNILGTEYAIEPRELKDEDIDGFCDNTQKLIVIRSDNENKVGDFKYLQKKQLRHEIVHAFMPETFEAIYKCRLCGKTFDYGVTGGGVAHATLVGLATNIDTSKITANKILLNEVHYCEDGSKGFADFQGFRKVVK